MSSIINEVKSNAPTALMNFAILGSAGWLGGKSLELIVPGVFPAAHAISLGLTAPASMVMYAVANRINAEGGYLNTLFALIGGYVASIGITNLLGFSVSLTAPFAGLTALTVLTGLVATVTIPIIVVAGLCLSCTLPGDPQTQGGGNGIGNLFARLFPLERESVPQTV